MYNRALQAPDEYRKVGKQKCEKRAVYWGRRWLSATGQMARVRERWVRVSPTMTARNIAWRRSVLGRDNGSNYDDAQQESSRARRSPDRITKTQSPRSHPVLSPHPCQCLDNGRSPPAMENAIINVIHKDKITDCNNYRGVSLVAHAGNAFLKIVTSGLLATTARIAAYSLRNNATFARQDQQSTCCFVPVACQRVLRCCDTRRPSTL